MGIPAVRSPGAVRPRQAPRRGEKSGLRTWHPFSSRRRKNDAGRNVTETALRLGCESAFQPRPICQAGWRRSRRSIIGATKRMELRRIFLLLDLHAHNWKCSRQYPFPISASGLTGISRAGGSAAISRFRLRLGDRSSTAAACGFAFSGPCPRVASQSASALQHDETNSVHTGTLSLRRCHRNMLAARFACRAVIVKPERG